MLNRISIPRVVMVVWLTAVTAITAGSFVMGASASTSTLLLVTAMAPIAVMFFLRWGAPSPTVAEVLRAVESQNETR
jgi:hypothetical protein